MGTGQFDRQVFLQSKEDPPRIPISMLAPLVLAGVVVLGGVLFYKFAIAETTSEVSSPRNAELTRIEEKLGTIEQRLDQLEKRRKATTSETAGAEAKEQKNNSAPPAPAPAPRTVYRIFPPRSVQNSSVAAASTPDPQVGYQKKEISALEREVTAGREEWEATTNRLGSVVGELGAQRSELDTNKATLNQLVDRLQRQDYRFTLQRRSGRLLVGPLALWLQNSDSRTGRYTMRVMVNDKWVEFKDRALHEAVDFYPSGSTVPIELVVSQMNRDQVAGKIAVPQYLGTQ
jgi:hypothetical protein